MNKLEGIRYFIKLNSAEILSDRTGAALSSGEVNLEVDTT